METPDQGQIVATVGAISNNVSRTLQKATHHASAWFAPEGRPFEPTMFACMVRYFARLYFGLDSEDEDALKSETLPNIGLEIYYNGYLFKILKAVDGLPPVPSSNARVNFYKQNPQMYLDRKAGALLPTSLHLMYLWECDDAHRLSDLQLYCPSNGGFSRAEIEKHWSVNLPIVRIPIADLESEDLPIERTAREDLPIDAVEGEAEAE